METAQPPLLSAPVNPGVPSPASRRRNTVTIKLIFIATLVLVLNLPLGLINGLRQERSHTNEAAVLARSDARELAPTPFEGYRMVERSLKYSVLVLTLVFTAFFLFETLAGLRLHAVHYGLVGGAMCLFYLALLALGEVLPPGVAYVGAAGASSLLIILYSVSILHSYARAGTIAALLAVEHGVLYVVLRMENYALLAGTATLFVSLAVVMFCTRNVDWFAQETGKEIRA